MIPSSPTLLGIPPEIRTLIYKYLMEGPFAEPIAKDKGCNYYRLARPLGCFDLGATPSILRVCPQLRSEFTQMFLANTDFAAEVHANLREQDQMVGSGYERVLNYLQYLGPQNTALVKSITIVSHDCWWYDVPYGDIGLVEIWDQFIPGLMNVGLRPEQLKWPGVCPGRAGRQTRADGCPWAEMSHIIAGGSVSAEISHIAVVYEALVMPTLRAYDCVSSQSPVMDVSSQSRALGWAHVYCPEFVEAMVGDLDSARARMAASLLLEKK